MKYPKLLVIGHAGHGKDEFCKILTQKTGISFESSSMYCLKKFLYNILKQKYGYTSLEEAFEDRTNHRAEWRKEIKRYNTPDLTRVGRGIFRTYDVYCGLRDLDEYSALMRLDIVDSVIWIDSSKRLPLESSESMQLSPKEANIIIDNNYDLDMLKRRVSLFIQAFQQRGFFV